MHVHIHPLAALFVFAVVGAVLAGIGALLLAWPLAVALWLWPGNEFALLCGWIGTGLWLALAAVGALTSRH